MNEFCENSQNIGTLIWKDSVLVFFYSDEDILKNLKTFPVIHKQTHTYTHIYFNIPEWKSKNVSWSKKTWFLVVKAISWSKLYPHICSLLPNDA